MKKTCLGRLAPLCCLLVSVSLPALSYGQAISSSLDHLVYTVPDLDQAVLEFEQRTGVRATPGGSHPGQGTRNALLALSESTYLEILAPDPAQPQAVQVKDEFKTPRLLTWLAKATRLDQQVEQASTHGYDLGAVTAMNRILPSGVLLQWRLTLPRTLLGDGLVPILIDWGASAHPATMAARGCSLAEFYGEHPQPETVQKILDAIGVQFQLRSGPAPALVAVLLTPKGKIVLR